MGVYAFPPQTESVGFFDSYFYQDWEVAGVKSNRARFYARSLLDNPFAIDFFVRHDSPMGLPGAIVDSVSLCVGVLKYIRLSQQPDAQMDILRRRWASDALTKLGFHLDVVGSPTESKSVLFVGNHVSYVDIALLMKTVPSFSFVAKKEISQWPVFGTGAKAIDTIFFQREKSSQRASARIAIREGLENGKRIVVFPAGTTSVDESKEWRRGAFEIAAETGAWIQPFRMSYAPIQTVAFIGKDSFPSHIVRLFKTDNLKARIEFHEPVKVTDPEASRKYCQSWARERVELI